MEYQQNRTLLVAARTAVNVWRSVSDIYPDESVLVGLDDVTRTIYIRAWIKTFYEHMFATVKAYCKFEKGLHATMEGKHKETCYWFREVFVVLPPRVAVAYNFPGVETFTHAITEYEGVTDSLEATWSVQAYKQGIVEKYMVTRLWAVLLCAQRYVVTLPEELWQGHILVNWRPAQECCGQGQPPKAVVQGYWSQLCVVQ